MRTYLNGNVVREGAVTEMIFPIDYIVADLSRFITLLPGDIILSGTPKNSRPMNVGDLVEVEVSGVGRLSNRVAEPGSGASSRASTDRYGFSPARCAGIRLLQGEGTVTGAESGTFSTPASTAASPTRELPRCRW